MEFVPVFQKKVWAGLVNKNMNPTLIFRVTRNSLRLPLPSVLALNQTDLRIYVSWWPQNSSQMYRGGVWREFKKTYFNMPNNVSSMKYALKSIPGIADVGVPHGEGDGPRTPPRNREVPGKNFKWLIILGLSIYLLWSMLLNQSLALLMLGSPMGLGMALEVHPDVWRGQEKVPND